MPAVVTLHDLAALHYPETLTWKIRWSLLPFLQPSIERATRIVTVSASVAAEIAAVWPQAAAKTEVIWNGVDAAFRPAGEPEIAATRQRLGLPEGYLLYVGTLEPRKNVELLVDAWQALRADWPAAPPLVIAGPEGWHSAALVRRFARLSAEGLHWLGHLPRAELVAVLQAATVFAFPSLYEGFGLPVAEAMACGVPVVVARRSSLPEVVGEAGLCFDPDEPHELAAVLAELLPDGDRLRRLATLGIDRARVFSWRTAGERLAGVFHQVLAGSPGAS